MKTRIDKIVNCMTNCVFYNVIISLSFLYYINPLKDIEITEFDRIIGDSVIAGISYDARIRNIYVYIVVFACLYIFFSHVINGVKKGSIYFEAFENGVKFLTAVLLVYFVNRFAIDKVISESLVLLEIQITLVIFLIFAKFSRNEISKNVISTVIIFSISMAFLIDMLFSRYLPTLCGTKTLWHLIFYTALFAGLLTFFAKRNNVIKESVYRILFLASFSPIVFRLYVEGYYILSDYGIIFISPYVIGLIILILFLLLAFSLRKRPYSFSRLTTIASIMLLATMVIISSSPGKVNILLWTGESTVYEWGNLFSAMNTVRYGKLPIAEYFSPHVMRDIVPGLIYGIMNKCKDGLMVAPYAKIIEQTAGIIVIFYIIKKEYGDLFSLAFCALLPLHYYTGFRMPTLCFSAIIVFWYIKDKNTMRSYFIYWSCLAWGVLYIIDEGFALGMATIFLTLILYLMGKLKLDFRRWLITGLLVGGLVLVYFIVGSMHRGVSIFTTIHQFLSATMNSNTTWAMRIIGDTEKFSFWWGYCFANIIAVIFLGMSLIMIWKNQIGYLESVTAIFCMASLLNIPRTIVFHNLAANPGIAYMYIPWIIAFGGSMAYKNRNYIKSRWIFLGGFVASVFIDCMSVGGGISAGNVDI